MLYPSSSSGTSISPNCRAWWSKGISSTGLGSISPPRINHAPVTPKRSANSCTFLANRSEEHTSELQSLMRISYAVFCLKKKKKTKIQYIPIHKQKYNKHLHTQFKQHISEITQMTSH